MPYVTVVCAVTVVCIVHGQYVSRTFLFIHSRFKEITSNSLIFIIACCLWVISSNSKVTGSLRNFEPQNCLRVHSETILRYNLGNSISKYVQTYTENLNSGELLNVGLIEISCIMLSESINLFSCSR